MKSDTAECNPPQERWGTESSAIGLTHTIQVIYSTNSRHRCLAFHSRENAWRVGYKKRISI